MRILASRAIRPRAATWLALLACVVLLAPGCQRLGIKWPGATDSAAEGTPSLVREDVEKALERFDDDYAEKVVAASNAIVASGVSPSARAAAVRWRLVTIPRVRQFAYSEDPLAGLLGTWEYCVQVRGYLESGEGKGLFESAQPIAITAAREIEAEIERVARELAPAAYVDNLKPLLVEGATNRPLTGVFGPPATLAPGIGSAAGAAALDVATRVAALPMIPLRTLTSVSDTSTSIADFTRTASRMADIVEEMPRDLRWQVQLLLADLEATGQLSGFSEAINNAALAVREGSATARELPPQVAAAAADLDTRVQSSTAALNAVLANADETLARMDDSIALANSSLAQAATLAPAAHGLMGDLRDTSEELRALVAEANSLYAALTPERDPDAPPGPGIEDITELLRQSQASAAELRAMLADFQALQAPASAFDAIEAQGNALIDRAFTRLLALVLVALAGAAGVVVLARWRKS